MLDKLQPYDLANVPSSMKEFIYEEEKKNGSVDCPENVYLVILALRWALYEWNEPDYYDASYHGESYPTWRVLWKPLDELHSRTEIYVLRERLERYDPEYEEWRVVMEPCYAKLATVVCEDSGSIIRAVRVEGGPYGSTLLTAVEGVCYLLEAAYGRNKWDGNLCLKRGTDSLELDDYPNTHSYLTVKWQPGAYGIGIATLTLECMEIARI